jgi:hypothetical protein
MALMIPAAEKASKSRNAPAAFRFRRIRRSRRSGLASVEPLLVRRFESIGDVFAEDVDHVTGWHCATFASGKNFDFRD